MLIPHNPPINSVSDIVFTGSSRRAFSSSFFPSPERFSTQHLCAACPSPAVPAPPSALLQRWGGKGVTIKSPGWEMQRAELTESQPGRGWQGPLWVTQPNPLPKQGHPEQAAQHRGQAGLEHLQRRRLHSLPGQPGPGLRHPQREEVLPHLQLELPMLQFVPVAPCPVAGHHWKELGPILLTPTLQIFISIY